MRAKTYLPVIAVLSAAVLAAGCSSTPASPGSTPSAPPSTAPVSTQTQSPTLTPTASPAPSRQPGEILKDTTAITVVDDVRVRSKPRVSDDSFKHEPLLRRGTPLYVLDGPVSASGYTWYEVAPLASRSLPRGWVASASRDGERWLGVDDFACPPLPTDFRTLAALPAGVGLACFPGMPITVEARLLACNCDVDGGRFEPSWFTFGGGPLLVEPAQTQPPSDVADWFPLHMDPAGHHDDVLPVDGVYPDPGQIVEVTGVFDHPAAASCMLAEMDGELAPSHDCRLTFAVTRLTAVSR